MASKKAQMKIQEMAFVLVAIMIFFAMVALVYFSIRLSSLQKDVSTQRQEGAKELAKKLADIPEFAWAGCSSGCIDAEKALAVKNRAVYDNFWDVDYLMIEKLYPKKPNVECTAANYPECTTITVINSTKYYGISSTAFVAICSYDRDKGGFIKCEMGRINAAGKTIK